MLVKLTAPLFDTRDPARPPVLIAAAGSMVPQEVADRFGGEYAEAKKRTGVENKKRSSEVKA